MTASCLPVTWTPPELHLFFYFLLIVSRVFCVIAMVPVSVAGLRRVLSDPRAARLLINPSVCPRQISATSGDVSIQSRRGARL